MTVEVVPVSRGNTENTLNCLWWGNRDILNHLFYRKQKKKNPCAKPGTNVKKINLSRAQVKYLFHFKGSVLIDIDVAYHQGCHVPVTSQYEVS